MSSGYVHVYTGNGKGKTTAAFGLAVRAALAGKKVYIGQFVKDMKYSETTVGEYIPNIVIEQLGLGCFIVEAPKASDYQAAEAALEHCGQHLKSGAYDVVVLDEIHIALHYALITVESVIEVLKSRAPHVEVITTGRYAPDALIAYADLVTEMKVIKHYYEKGVLSRPGIDC